MPHHTQAWYYHLIAINLFTYGIFQTVVFEAFLHLSQSFVAPVSTFLKTRCWYQIHIKNIVTKIQKIDEKK